LSAGHGPTHNANLSRSEKFGDRIVLSSWSRQLIVGVTLLASAIALSGCGSSDLFSSESRLSLSPSKLFSSQDWATATKIKPADTISAAPVAPEDYVDASGRCGALAAAAAEPADAAVGSVAGDLAGVAAPQPASAPATVPGGVALGMTECQVAQRAGQPAQVNITADATSERKTVLTYLSGPWPGIYTFSGGRLKEIERVAQPEQPKTARKKAKSTKPATASVR
jgi:hypothetical protein